MPSIYESQYHKTRLETSRARRGCSTPKEEIIELQRKHWDEIKACLEEDENYKLFKKKSEEYFRKQNPEFNDEKRNSLLLFEYYYMMEGGGRKQDYNDQEEGLNDETDAVQNQEEEDENSQEEYYTSNNEFNPEIASALVSEAQWKQCHVDLKTMIQEETDVDKIRNKFWTLENALTGSSQNEIENAKLALELCHSCILKHMHQNHGEVENKAKENMMGMISSGMMEQGLFSSVESMNQDPDFLNAIQTILPQIMPHTAEVRNYETLVDDFNDLRKEALKKIKKKIDAILGAGSNHNETNFNQETDILTLLLDHDDENHLLTGTITTTIPPNKFSTLEYLFWILSDYGGIKATIEVEKMVCWILFQSLSFKSLQAEFKKKGIGACKSSLQYLNLSPKEGFPPIDPILNFIENNCNKIEDLPKDFQAKLPQMRENMNSNNPDVLKTTISFFQNVPVHQLVEWGLVSRCINILAGEGVIATASTKPTNNDYRYSYYPMTRKDINVLKDTNLSLEILDLLYNILLDGEYAGVAVEEADDGLAVIQNYLSDQFGNQICEKTTQIILNIMKISKSREVYQDKICRYYNHYQHRYHRQFRCQNEMKDLINCATNESCSNLFFALEINAVNHGSHSIINWDEHTSALLKLEKMTENIDESTATTLGLNATRGRGSRYIPSLLRFFSTGRKVQKASVCRILHNCISQYPSTTSLITNDGKFHRWGYYNSMKRMKRNLIFEPIPLLEEVLSLLELSMTSGLKKKFKASPFVLEDKRHKEQFQEDLTFNLQHVSSPIARMISCCVKCCECCSKSKTDMDDLSKSTIKVNQTSNGDEKDIDLKALETKLRHQPEYWHTARRFYAPDKDTGKRQRRGQKSGNNRNGEHWDVFTRDNLLRVRHAVGPAGGNYYYGVHSFSHDEKITVFESAEKCDSEAEKLYSSLLDDKECEEFDTFGEAYRHSSKPYWMWVLESQTDATIPCYASKIGGAPAVYLDLARQRDFYEECDFSFGTFMFQIDLSTIPERLQEYLGSNNGLLQFYNTGGDEEAGISTTLIPAEDFPLLVKGRESDSKVPVIPIAGWVEKYDFIGYSEPLEKFGGYYVDVQCEYQEIGPEKFLFESRDCSNIFHLNTGDGGNIQYFGYKNGSGGWTNFSCH